MHDATCQTLRAFNRFTGSSFRDLEPCYYGLFGPLGVLLACFMSRRVL